MRILISCLVLAMALACGCGDDGDGASDARVTDGDVTGDASGMTRCGPNLVCSSDTELCVANDGIVATFACMPIPAGCDGDRTCACVAEPLCGTEITCVDSEPNSIQCCAKCN